MARSAAGFFCLALLALPAAARRTRESESLLLSDGEGRHAEVQASEHTEEHGEVQAAWTSGVHLKELEAETSWCTSKDEILECEEGFVIKIRTAFYSNMQKGECVKPPDANKAVQCKAKKEAVEVAEACNGHQKCLISTDKHTTCPENPFTFMRVRYYCIEGQQNLGNPVTAAVEAQVQTLQQEADEKQPIKPGTTKEQTWCTSLEETLFCEEGQTIRVKSAMYNRNKLNTCWPAASERILAKEVSCKRSVFKDYGQLCNGKTKCTIEPHEHLNCPDHPFTFLRIVYKCGDHQKDAVQGRNHLE